MGSALQVRRLPPKSPDTAERQQAYKEMNEALRTEAEEIEDLMREESTTVVKNRWILGSKIAVIDADPKLYGNSSLRLLSSYFGLHKDILNGCHLFYQRYPKDQLDHLLDARTKQHGYAVGWSHVNELVRLADAKARKQFLDTIVKEELTVQALKVRIDEFLGGHRVTAIDGGHSIRAPKKLEGYLNQISSTTKSILERRALWESPEFGIMAIYEQTPPDELDATKAELLQTSEDEVFSLADGLTSLGREIRRVRLKLEQHLQETTVASGKVITPEEDEE